MNRLVSKIFRNQTNKEHQRNHPIVKDKSEVESAIGEAAKYGRELLIEKFVSGRELTIGILGDQALPILEIIPKGGFYDFNNKYPFLNPQAGGGAEHVCPAMVSRQRCHGRFNRTPRP